MTAGHKLMRGHADVREFLEAIWRAMPDMTFEPLSGPYVIPGEPRVAVHWRGWATLTGPLEPPGFEPTGRRWELDGGDFYEFRDGRMCKLRTAYDVLSVSRQLGLLPAAGGRAERALAMAQRFASRVQQAIRRAAYRDTERVGRQFQQEQRGEPIVPDGGPDRGSTPPAQHVRVRVIPPVHRRRAERSADISMLWPSRRIQPCWVKSARTLLTVSREAPMSWASSS